MNNDPQQPFTHYPPPEQPPRKKRGPLFWILVIGGLFLAFGLCRGIIQAASSTSTPAAQATSTPGTQGTTQPTATDTPIPTATDTPTPAPTPKPLKWTTTHTFSGNGSKKTGTFSTPDDWLIKWTCTPASSYGGEYNLILDVYNSDGTSFDLGTINTICKTGNTHDDTEMHQGGSVYLDIVSEGAWVITIQEMK